jgi:hypothetical protein
MIVYLATIPMALRSYRRQLTETPVADHADVAADGEERAFAPVAEAAEETDSEGAGGTPPRLP